jgi:multidrug resistance efflux pump
MALIYPLEAIIKVKERRVENQEKVVKEKELALQKEKDKLAQCEAARDKAKEHLQNKLTQLRQELDHSTTTDKVQQMKAYLNVAKDKLAVEEKKVKDQQLQVDNANKALEAAKEELRIKRQEVEKLQIHKKDWLVTARRELEIIEGREQDEVGSITHATHQRRIKSH